MNVKARLLVGAVLLATLVGILLFAPQFSKSANSAGPKNRVLNRALDIETGRAKKGDHEQLLSSGTMYALLEASGELDKRANAAPSLPNQAPVFSQRNTQGCQNVFKGPDGLLNIRVNQDCSLRRQAEEVIVANPKDPKNLIAGQNDSRIGYNHCGYDWSFDGGKTWGDQIPPFYQFLNLDGVIFDACSDPTATFDSVGNAYIGGVVFEIKYADSAFLVMKSNAGIGGAFYHSPLVQPFQTYRDTPVGVVANDNDPNIAHDKEFIVADASPSSPKKNNVYATWTRFDFNTKAGVGGHSPIYFSQSTDGGATWSPGIEISGSSVACTIASGEANPNACDQDQGSHPIVGKDGTVYVAFTNGNVPGAGIGQHLIVKCLPGSNCSLPASWTAPVKISDDFGLQPLGPDTTSGCPGGRQCLPPNGYRMDDFVEGSISVDNSGKLYAVWADGRNIKSGCVFPTPAPGSCDNDVFYSYSTNGGATWSAAFNLTPKNHFGGTAQWMPWSAIAPDGKTLFVAYYDRSYGNCETTGCNDITLATLKNPASATPNVDYKRLTTASMPNLVPANNPLQAGFLGDYMWVSTDVKGRPHIAWADTRGLGGTVEEDIYTARWNGDDED